MPRRSPAFRLTEIGPPTMDNSDHLQEVGWKLAQFAEMIHVEFEFRGFVANNLADHDASMLELRLSETESVAVNSVFEFHKLLAWPGAVEKVLSVVKQIKPEIVTVVEQEANHNGLGFLNQFTESLHYYSTMFDSLEGSTVESQDKVPQKRWMSEWNLGAVVQLKELILNNLLYLQKIRLERFVIFGFPNLISLAPSSVSFSYLTYLEVINCLRLRNLMTSATAKSLVQLTTMKVSHCTMIVEIVVESKTKMKKQKRLSLDN